MTNREIGSEFWDVPVTNWENDVFPGNAQWFLAGRSALQAIAEEIRGYHTVAVPSWCCESMVKPFIDAGKEVHFYPVYWRDILHQQINLDCDVLFLMNYFGYSDNSLDLGGYEGVIIRDVTHSVFSTAYYDAHYCFGSLRKWCGVWTGGFGWTNDERKLSILDTDKTGYIALRKKAMQMKESYMNGRGESDKSYLKVFSKAEEALRNKSIAPAAERDVLIAKKIDINFMRSRRRENAKVLMSAFANWLMFPTMRDSDCPMFVPILVPDGKRDQLRKHLINNDIYCPIHWPISSYHILTEQERFIYDNELSLVCDQRYTVQDMNRMIDVINQFRKGM